MWRETRSVKIMGELHESGRWLHVIIKPVDGKQSINFLVVYGIFANPKFNEGIWNVILTYVPELLRA